MTFTARITEFFDRRADARQARLADLATPESTDAVEAYRTASARVASALSVQQFTFALATRALRAAGYSNADIAEILDVPRSQVWAANTLLPHLTPRPGATPQEWVAAWNQAWQHRPEEQVEQPLVEFPGER